MTSTLILTTLLVFSFAVGRFIRKFQTPNFIFSGMIYLLMGLLLGSHLGVGVLSTELIEKLQPLISLLVGITGYLLGLRVKTLVQHRRVMVAGFFSAGFIFVFVLICFLWLALFLLPQETAILNFIPIRLWGQTFSPTLELNQLWFCLGIGATACSASLLNLGTATRLDANTSEVTKVLQVMTKTLQCSAILLIGSCLAMAQASTSANNLQLTLIQWVVACILSGVICGFLFSLFIGKQSNKDRILLAALGTIIFACGIGHILGVSSLFVAFMTGGTISLFSKYAESIQTNLVRLEEPIFVLLLVISGASWQPELGLLLWVLPLCYFAVRFVILSTFVAPLYSQIRKKNLSRLGQGLLGQDLMAVSLALSFTSQFPQVAQLFFTTILGSIFLNDILASSLLKKVILDNEQTTAFQALKTQEEAQ